MTFFEDEDPRYTDHRTEVEKLKDENRNLQMRVEALRKDATYYKFVAENERKNYEYVSRRLRELVRYVVDNYEERSDS